MRNEKKEKLITNILVGVITLFVIVALFSCNTYKYGCKEAYGSVGHGAEYKAKKINYRQ